jgi:copper chaperone CopZ
MKMEGSVSSSASQPPGESPWKIAAKPNNIAKVAHSITLALPGKVAFCVPRINDDPQYLQRLQALIKKQPGIINLQVNPEAGSVVITYKIGMMSDYEMRSELARLLQTADVQVGEQRGSTSATLSDRGAEEQRGSVSTSLTNQGAEEQGKSIELRTQHSELSTQNSGLETQDSKVTYSIVHAIPGRIRFHIPQIACDRKYVQRLENLLKADPVVTSERINPDAASVVITYQTGTLRDSQERTHNVVEAAIKRFTSLIQSANEATAGIAANTASRI